MSIKGGEVRRLIEKSILNFHFDYWNPSLSFKIWTIDKYHQSLRHINNKEDLLESSSPESKSNLPTVNCSHWHNFGRLLWQVGLKQHPLFPPLSGLTLHSGEHHRQSLAPVVACDCCVLSQALQSRLGQRKASLEKQEAAQLSPCPQLTDTGLPSSLQHVAVTSVSPNVITSL